MAIISIQTQEKIAELENYLKSDALSSKRANAGRNFDSERERQEAIE